MSELSFGYVYSNLIFWKKDLDFIIFIYLHIFPLSSPPICIYFDKKKKKSIKMYICKGCAKLKRREMYDNWCSLCLSEDNYEWFSFPMSFKVHYKRLLRKINT